MNAMDVRFMETWFHKVTPYVPEDSVGLVREFEQLLQEKLQADRREITIYGIYSHGKSTLINALLGEEVAQVGICPTTDAVHAYPWRGFSLLDTPGIDAPIAHQQIAEKQLAKSELVLFVLQSEEVEAQAAWKKMVSIAGNGQKIILVINDFSGIRGDAEKSIKFRDRYRQNLQKEAKEQGVDAILEKISLCVVNAKSALRAKLENKGTLLATSGITELEALVVERTRSVTDDDVHSTLRRHLLNLISLCEAGLYDAEQGVFIREGERSLAKIRDTRDLVSLKILQQIDKLLDDCTSQIRECFEDATTESDVRARLTTVMESLTEPLEKVIQDEMARAKKRIEDICTDFDKLAAIPLHGTPIDTDVPEGPSLFDQAMNLPWRQVLEGMQWDLSMQEIVVKLLSTAKQWLPNLFKGMGAKTMEKWASAIATKLGPVLLVAGAAYDFYKSIKQEQEQRDAASRRTHAITDAVKSVQHQVRTMFETQVNTILDDAFIPLERELEQQIKQVKMQEIHNESARTLLEKARAACTTEIRKRIERKPGSYPSRKIGEHENQKLTTH